MKKYNEDIKKAIENAKNAIVSAEAELRVDVEESLEKARIEDGFVFVNIPMEIRYKPYILENSSKRVEKLLKKTAQRWAGRKPRVFISREDDYVTGEPRSWEITIVF